MFLRQKATAARAPAPKSAAGPAVVPDIGPATVESLGRQLREVLPARRLQSVSLYDHDANVLWLSEGALGPDEHSVVAEALELLTADISLASHELSLEDGRVALFLAVRAPTGNLVGIAMILADGKSVGDDTMERMAAAPVRAIMLRLAVLLKPFESGANGSAPVPVVAEFIQPLSVQAVGITPAEVNDILEFELFEQTPVTVTASKSANGAAAPASLEMVTLEFMPESQPAPAAAPAPVALKPAPAAPVVPVSAPIPRAAPISIAPYGPAAAPKAAPRAAPAPLTAPAPATAPIGIGPYGPAASKVPAPAAAPISIAPHGPGASKAAAQAAAIPVAAPVTVAVVAPSNDPNLLLEVLPFAKLRAGGQSRRFQVLARLSPGQRDPAAVDALVLQRLMAWLSAHRTAWSSQPTGFTVNLSIATLEDDRFAQKLAAALNSHGIGGETLGFEITEALCTQRRAQVERFITQCEKIGAWIVIDDFSFDAQVLPLLRSKAARLVKIDAKLTSCALKDKLSQAMVVATIQAAKVMGIHVSAKKVESQAALQWLTAIGCDFAQGSALAAPQALDSLASSL